MAEVPAAARPSAARLVAQVDAERQQQSIDSRGRIKYRTNRYLVVTNEGDREARNVSVELAAPAGASEQIPRLVDGTPAEVLPPGGSLRYPLLVGLGMSPVATVIMRFTLEDGREQENRQSLTIY